MTPRTLIPPRDPRQKDERHLAFIRLLPCLVTLTRPVDAAHVRYASPAHGKRAVGMAEKPHDRWTVPLCRDQHQRQHEVAEKSFWEAVGIDPLKVASELYAISGNVEAGERIIQAIHQGKWQ